MRYVTIPVRMSDRGATFGMQRVSNSRKEAAHDRNAILGEKDGSRTRRGGGRRMVKDTVRARPLSAARVNRYRIIMACLWGSLLSSMLVFAIGLHASPGDAIHYAVGGLLALLVGLSFSVAATLAS